MHWWIELVVVLRIKKCHLAMQINEKKMSFGCANPYVSSWHFHLAWLYCVPLSQHQHQHHRHHCHHHYHMIASSLLQTCDQVAHFFFAGLYVRRCHWHCVSFASSTHTADGALAAAGYIAAKSANAITGASTSSRVYGCSECNCWHLFYANTILTATSRNSSSISGGDMSKCCIVCSMRYSYAV